MFDFSTIESVAQWPKVRPSIESSVLGVLGKMPKNREDLQVKIVDEVEGLGYVRQRINYFVDEWERISAWLFIPDGQEDGPAIVCCHDAVAQGKEEPAGINGDPILALAKHYAEMGYATLAPDSITAGERISPGLDAYDTKMFYKDNPRSSAAGKMLWDHITAIEVLCETKRVDASRIGVVGHGLGALNAIMLTAFDERIHTCVASCGITRFNDDDDPARWTGGAPLNYFPKLKKAVEEKNFPFDWEHIIALAAPNPLMMITALNDEVLSKTKSCDKAVKLASTIYKMLGSKNALDHVTHRDGHSLTMSQRDLADEWFERWL
jgi:cephalosporin-C deacetylase-like acetyl esterase